MIVIIDVDSRAVVDFLFWTIFRKIKVPPTPALQDSFPLLSSHYNLIKTFLPIKYF